MKKCSLKVLSLLLSGMMLSGALAGCGEKPKEDVTPSSDAPGQTAEEILYSFKDVKDSSELPDWTGAKQKLTVWYGHGTGSSLSREFPEKNIVNDEIERVTGVSIDVENSFDNDGQDFKMKLGMIAASNDWPDLIIEGDIKSKDDDMIVGGKLWELSEQIPQYLPDLYDIYPKDKVNWWDKENAPNSEGKIHIISTGLNISYLSDLNPDMDPARLSRIQPPNDKNGLFGYILVRDDILKQVYPEAKSVKEIEEVFMANGGTFKNEDLYDVKISSYDDLKVLLEKVSTVKTTESGKAVEPFFCMSGEDNWPLMAFLDGYLNGRGDGNTYFTYWDNTDKKVKYMFEQPFFKDALKFYNGLQKQGLASREALVDNKSIFTTKLNNGQYATSYAWILPDKAALAASGAEFNYRKVFIDVPWNKDFVMFKGVPSSHYNFSIVKDAVSAEELPQIMRWIGFNISDAGSKLQQWGPKSANLWEEDANGNRKFTDKALEDEIVYKVANGRQKQLGLGNLIFPGLPVHVNGSDENSPLYMYEDVKLEASAADTYFRSGLLEPSKPTLGVPAEIFNFFEFVPETDRFWAARPGFESLMTKCIAAESDQQFEKLYADLLDYAKTNGLTEETLEQVNKAYVEHVNKDYIKLIQ